MRQMTPFCSYLEDLNHKFSYHRLGIPLWTFSERNPIRFEGPSHGTNSGVGISPALPNSLAPGGLEIRIVDQTSSKLRNIKQHIMVDEEDWAPLATDHAGIAKLGNNSESQGVFLERIGKVLDERNMQEHRDHKTLLRKIFEGTKIEQHILRPQIEGGEVESVQVESAPISLRLFIEHGPRPLPHLPLDLVSAAQDTEKPKETVFSVPNSAINHALISGMQATKSDAALRPDAGASVSNPVPSSERPSAARKPSMLQTRKLTFSRRSSSTDDDEATNPTI